MMQKDKEDSNNSGLQEIPRHVDWLYARKNRQGGYDEAVKEVADKIESISQQSDLTTSGHDDILSKAIGTSEHPGRVRGVGSGVGIKSYFGPKPKAKRKYPDDRDMELVKAEIENKFQSKIDRLSDLLLKVAAGERPSNLAQLVEDIKGKEDQSYQASCSEKFPLGWSTHALLSHIAPYQVVAIGEVFHSTEPVKLHNIELEPGVMRVNVLDPKVRDAPLPLPSDEYKSIADAIGTHVPWPKHLIGRVSESCSTNALVKPTSIPHKENLDQSQKPLPSHALRKSTKSFGIGGISHGQSKEVTGKKSKLTFEHETKLSTVAIRYAYLASKDMEELCGIPSDIRMRGVEHTDYLSREELRHFLLQDMIGATEVAVYCSYLFKRCEKEGLLHQIGFVCPHGSGYISHPHKEQEKAKFICDAMKGAQPDKIFLVPLILNGHWRLIVIHPHKNFACWIDPLRLGIDENIQRIVNTAVRMWQSTSNAKNSKKKTYGMFVKRVLNNPT